MLSMKPLAEVLTELQSRADCRFLLGSQLPAIPPGLQLPADLIAF
jgi:hypothetical protein